MTDQLNLVKICPGRELIPYIDHFYVLKGRLTNENREKERWFPEGTVEALFSLGDPIKQGLTGQPLQRRPMASLTGLFEESVQILPMGQIHLLGVIFKPGKFQHVLPLGTNDIKGEVIDLRDIGRLPIEPLLEKLQQQSTDQEHFHTLNDFLIPLLRPTLPTNFFIDRVIEKISAAKGNVSIQSLIGHKKISPRHFRRTFKNIVGLSPKIYAKLIRLTHIAKNLQLGKHDLAMLAFELGYCDTSHLSNDFKAVSGIAPKNYCRDINPIFQKFALLEN